MLNAQPFIGELYIHYQPCLCVSVLPSHRSRRLLWQSCLSPSWVHLAGYWPTWRTTRINSRRRKRMWRGRRQRKRDNAVSCWLSGPWYTLRCGIKDLSDVIPPPSSFSLSLFPPPSFQTEIPVLFALLFSLHMHFALLTPYSIYLCIYQPLTNKPIYSTNQMRLGLLCFLYPCSRGRYSGLLEACCTTAPPGGFVSENWSSFCICSNQKVHTVYHLSNTWIGT